jgi:hypothetical protein
VFYGQGINNLVQNDLMGQFNKPVLIRWHIEIDVTATTQAVLGQEAAEGENLHPANASGSQNRVDDVF